MLSRQFYARTVYRKPSGESSSNVTYFVTIFLYLTEPRSNETYLKIAKTAIDSCSSGSSWPCRYTQLLSLTVSVRGDCRPIVWWKCTSLCTFTNDCDKVVRDTIVRDTTTLRDFVNKHCEKKHWKCMKLVTLIVLLVAVI